MGKRIILATIGSLGDLHPFIAVALALKQLGHDPVLAVPLDNVDKVRRAGLEAHAVFPSFEEIGRSLDVDEGAATRRMMRDPDYLVRRVFLELLPASVGKLEAVAKGADAIISSSFAPGPIVAEKLSIPLIPALFQPMMMFSAHEPPIAPDFWSLIPFPKTPGGVGWNRRLLGLVMLEMRRRYAGKVDRVRRAHGLAPARPPPIFGLPTDAPLVLGLWSPILGARQPDHPPNTLVAGFAPFDSDSGAPEQLDPELDAFLIAGEPPLVFTLGSFAVYAPGDFYAHSLAAARALGRRAVLLTGPGAPPPTAPDVLARAYAPHSLVFPRAAAIIHHGGSGTTGAAMRSGRPQLVVSHMGDQYDHAARLARLGCALSLTARRYTSARAAPLIQRLLTDTRIAEAAASVAARISPERGAQTAAEAIVRVLG
jgi:UDP:flavonoid glycosyltransferase YjiC (YdhE family)